jgi:hypothetical protein
MSKELIPSMCNVCVCGTVPQLCHDRRQGLSRHMTQRLCCAAVHPFCTIYESMQRRSRKYYPTLSVECCGDEVISARPSRRHANFAAPVPDIATTPHKATILPGKLKLLYFRVWAKQRTDPYQENLNNNDNKTVDAAFGSGAHLTV